MTDLIGGQVDLLLVQGAVALPQVRAGTIKALVNLAPRRSPSMPDIPSADEAGVPGFYMLRLVRLLRAQGHAARGDRQAERRHGSGVGRPRAARQVCQFRARCRFARAADAARPRRVPKAEIEKRWPIIKAAGIRGD